MIVDYCRLKHYLQVFNSEINHNFTIWHFFYRLTGKQGRNTLMRNIFVCYKFSRVLNFAKFRTVQIFQKYKIAKIKSTREKFKEWSKITKIPNKSKFLVLYLILLRLYAPYKRFLSPIKQNLHVFHRFLVFKHFEILWIAKFNTRKTCFLEKNSLFAKSIKNYNTPKCILLRYPM